jgi:hypothetical protein
MTLLIKKTYTYEFVLQLNQISPCLCLLFLSSNKHHSCITLLLWLLFKVHIALPLTRKLRALVVYIDLVIRATIGLILLMKLAIKKDLDNTF